MVAKNERVMEMVRSEIEKNPSVGSQELFVKAKKMDPRLNRLSIQQFHAGYPLQVKRLLKQSMPGGGGAGGVPARRRPGRPRRTEATATAEKAAEKAPPRRRRRMRTPMAATGTEARVAARSGRDTVRSVLIKFAGEIAAADQKADVVAVIGGMDRYVEQVMSVAGA